MSDKKRRWWRILIDHDVQVTLVLRAMRLWFYHAVLLMGVLIVFQLLLGGVFRPWSEHWTMLKPVVGSVVFSMVILLPVFVHDSFKMSHRVVGPVMRVRRALREIVEGKPYEPLSFREKDFWPDLAGELNAAVAHLLAQAESVADKVAEDASVANELVADELVEDELVADELVEDELVEDMLAADDATARPHPRVAISRR